MNERVKFIADVLKGEESITELCLRYAISRKTGYKWMERFIYGDRFAVRRVRNVGHIK